MLLVFSTVRPSPTPRFSPVVTLGASLVLLGLFALVNRWSFQRLAARISRDAARAQVAVLYHRCVNRQSLLALLFFFFHLYLLDIKSHVNAVALVRSSFTLQGLAALGLFLLYLGIVWFYSHGCQCRLSATRCSRASVVVANFKFNLAILLPWLFISGVFEMLQLLPVDVVNQGLGTPLGQILLFTVLLIFFMLFAPPLVVHLWSCRPLPAGPQRSLIERFCAEHNFHIREILVWPTFGTDLPTAGVMGLHRGCRYLLLTPSLLTMLDGRELQGVLAHEMGHVQERHHLFYLLFLLGYLVLAYSVLDLSLLGVLASDLVWKLISWPDSNYFSLASVFSTLPLLVLLIVYFRYLFGFFIRNFERQADLQVFDVLGEPLPLISALEKTALYSGNIREVPSWHHFSIKERVDYLLAAARRPSLLEHHRRKLKVALGLYLIGLTTVGVMGYLYHTQKLGVALNDHLLIKVLGRQVDLQPENSQLRFALGTLYFQKSNLEKAVYHLEAALALDRGNPEIMNNLAWVLATTRESSLGEPDRALKLAKRAARASPKAYILDTLAEAYHATGQEKQALAAAKKALAAASGDRSSYLEKVEKFRAFVEDNQTTFRE
ncbi:MAG: M48 family metalloprotease [Syntrophobacteria bacterium]